MAKKKFNFPAQNSLPFYFVSSSDGTNVVRVFKEAIALAIMNKEQPPDEVMAEIYNLLRDDDSKDGALGIGFGDETPSPTPPSGTPEPR
mmetsp:Transcript_148865/g.476758  ORF Transcript_148865/g.476758 Transcript_148865/m.476758 type:complete len:89 (-) Transcript_148865:268-534(-)